MKKLYIAPEMEIKKFSVEDIMTASATSAPVYGNDDVAGATGAGKVESVEYSTLFGLNN